MGRHSRTGIPCGISLYPGHLGVKPGLKPRWGSPEPPRTTSGGQIPHSWLTAGWGLSALIRFMRANGARPGSERGRGALPHCRRPDRSHGTRWLCRCHSAGVTTNRASGSRSWPRLGPGHRRAHWLDFERTLTNKASTADARSHEIPTDDRWTQIMA